MAFPENVIAGNDANASSALAFAMSMLQQDVAAGRLPPTFPIHLWQNQATRYSSYWSWHTGEALEEIIGNTEEGEPVYRYPLKVNPVRDFARKHAALLFGEVPDTPTPLVKTLISPKTIFGESTQAQKEQGTFLSNFVNEVWTQSNGRSIQYENGEISQFLGGSVFKVCYQPWRQDLLIPIVLQNWYPNYFLPIWSADSYYDLLEAWLVYRVDPVVASIQWGTEFEYNRAPAIYCEHWTRDSYSITVNGQPLKATYSNGVKVDYTNAVNPFGFVPFVYIPRLREGSYYGSSLVPDVAGLALEFNARAADEGDAMRKAAHQDYVGKNISVQVERKPMDSRGNEYYDIGKTNPLNDAEPSLDALDPPKWDKAYSEHKEFLRAEMMRLASLGPISYGEDEGSQRSALTLAFRMWPSTIIAKAQRTFWTDGLIQVARYILKMAALKKMMVAGRTVPADFDRLYAIVPQWLPMIPRDREAMTNEMVIRSQALLVPPRQALETFGDVPDIEEGMKQIETWAYFLAEVEAAKKALVGDVKTQTSGPTATSGLKEEPSE